MKKWTKEYEKSCIAAKGVLLIYLSTILLIIMGSLSAQVRVWKNGYANYSLADCFVATQRLWEFGILIIPVTILFLLHFFKRENRVCLIIREESRSMIWNKQVYKCLLFSLLITLFFQSSIFIVGGLASNTYINWSQVGTVYFEQTEKHTNNISFYSYLLIATVMVFLKFFCISLMVVLSNWVMKRREFFMAAAMLVSALEFFLRNIPIRVFSGIINISYDRWLSNRVLSGGLYGILLLIILWFTGLVCAKRKDFLNEGN